MSGLFNFCLLTLTVKPKFSNKHPLASLGMHRIDNVSILALWNSICQKLIGFLDLSNLFNPKDFNNWVAIDLQKRQQIGRSHGC